MGPTIRLFQFLPAFVSGAGGLALRCSHYITATKPARDPQALFRTFVRSEITHPVRIFGCVFGVGFFTHMHQLGGQMTLSDDILLIEDEPGVMDVMQRVLRRAGYTVRSAHDGSTALLELERQQPALVILDLVLPGISGFAVLSHIQEHYPALPVVAITANPHALAHPAAQGVQHYLLKPFHVEELLDMVTRARVYNSGLTLRRS
jgi:CheY-like chemotaxis protein